MTPHCVFPVTPQRPSLSANDSNRCRISAHEEKLSLSKPHSVNTSLFRYWQTGALKRALIAASCALVEVHTADPMLGSIQAYHLY